MAGSPHRRTVLCMQTQAGYGHHAAIERPGINRTPCALCTHAEFLHCDDDLRRCLYSECACSGFAMDVAA